jgi:protein tyrosine/serine phosphatase
MTNLRKHKAVYFHCIWGADRTGLLSMLLEGLLGVPQDQSNKNYELTTFSLGGLRVREKQNEMYDVILGLSGKTVKEKFNTFFVEKLGVSQQEIDEFRSIMLTSDLSDALSDIAPEQPTLQRTATFYDLSGRPVPATFHRKGIYIHNGKKLIVK